MIQFAWPIAQMILGALAGEFASRGLSSLATKYIAKDVAKRTGARLASSMLGARIARMAADPRMPGFVGKRLNPEALGRGAVEAGKFIAHQGAFIGGMAGAGALLETAGTEEADPNDAFAISQMPQPDRIQQDVWMGAYSEQEAMRQALEQIMSERSRYAGGIY